MQIDIRQRNIKILDKDENQLEPILLTILSDLLFIVLTRLTHKFITNVIHTPL